MSGAVAAARRGVSTPGMLKRLLAAILVLAALAAAASLVAAARIRDAAQTIGRDAEPSVALALRMTAALSDMDAAALADSLTGSGEATGTSIQFRDDLSRLTDDVVEASRDVTYGEAEAGPLRRLQRALSLYEEAVVASRQSGGDAWLGSRRVQWASRVDQAFAIPAAGALAQANATELERRYAIYRATSLGYAAAALAACALLAGAQVFAQIWLARRTRRWVNPALAAATLIALATALWTGGSALGERADLRAAKSDAYDSLRALFEAKAAVSALRADASLWLLDPDARTAAQTRLDDDARVLAGTDLDAPGTVRALLDGLGAALEDERLGAAGKARAETPRLGGLLGTELDNVTFGVPERDAATQSVARLADAERLVRAVQEDASRSRALAVARWLDERPGGGAAAFSAVQSALDRTIDVNQAEFDRRVSQALRTAALMPFVTTGALAVSALLSAAGLSLRLREYR